MSTERSTSGSDVLETLGNPQAMQDFVGEYASASAKLAGEALGRWQREATEFNAERMRAAIGLQAALPACKNALEAIELQQEWAVQAAQACLLETGKLWLLGSEIARDGIECWTEAARQAVQRSLAAASVVS
jgi:hypothetical protein